MAEDMRYLLDRRKGEGHRLLRCKRRGERHEIPKGCKGKSEG